MNGSPYGWLMLGGIVVSLVLWSRIARRDERLLFIYIAALIGAFLGGQSRLHPGRRLAALWPTGHVAATGDW